jgi:23S rRNA (uridine2552-2'-O)-methyltransferase
MERAILPRAKDPKRVADFWTRKARHEKYPARSVYKLKEIDQKHRLIRTGFRVLDLGAAPGAWLKYTAHCVGRQGSVLGIDLHHIEIDLTPNMRFIQGDIFEIETAELIENGLFDLVLSDMAPATTGVKSVDQARSVELAETALAVSQAVLKKGGALLVKIFEGPDVKGYFDDLSVLFQDVKRIKPKSSRRVSPEFFGLGQDFRGRKDE